MPPVCDGSMASGERQLAAAGSERASPPVSETKHPAYCVAEFIGSPAPELRRRLVQSAGPCDQIVDASRCQQRTLGVGPFHAEIFRVGNDAAFTQPGRAFRIRLPTYVGDTSDGCKGCPSFFPFDLVQIRDAFLGDDVSDIVTVD